LTKVKSVNVRNNGTQRKEKIYERLLQLQEQNKKHDHAAVLNSRKNHMCELGIERSRNHGTRAIKRKGRKMRVRNSTATFPIIRKWLSGLDMTIPELAERLEPPRGSTYVSERLRGVHPWDMTDVYQIMNMMNQPPENIHVVFPKGGRP